MPATSAGMTDGREAGMRKTLFESLTHGPLTERGARAG